MILKTNDHNYHVPIIIQILRPILQEGKTFSFENKKKNGKIETLKQM